MWWRGCKWRCSAADETRKSLNKWRAWEGQVAHQECNEMVGEVGGGSTAPELTMDSAAGVEEEDPIRLPLNVP